MPLSRATAATPAASNRHNGEYSIVSSRANRLPRTRLKKPTYLNSPMARPSKPKARARDSHDRTRGGTGTSITPPVAATRVPNSSKITPTAAVALADGMNNGLPSILGTAPPPLPAGENAMRKCQRARATKTRLMDEARTSFTRSLNHSGAVCPPPRRTPLRVFQWLA